MTCWLAWTWLCNGKTNRTFSKLTVGTLSQNILKFSFWWNCSHPGKNISTYFLRRDQDAHEDCMPYKKYSMSSACVCVCFQTIWSTARLFQKVKSQNVDHVREWIWQQHKGNQNKIYFLNGQIYIHTLAMPLNCFYFCLSLFLSLELGNSSKHWKSSGKHQDFKRTW